MHRVTQVDDTDTATTIAATFQLHEELKHQAKQSFSGSFIYGHGFARISLSECVDEQALLFSVSPTSATASSCDMILSPDALECALFIAGPSECELVRAYSMHDRSVKLTPRERDGGGLAAAHRRAGR